MLFNSPIFFAFVAATFAIYTVLMARGYSRATIYFLTFASLVFYGWWNPRYLPLLIGSIVVNYWLGVLIAKRVGTPAAKRLLLLGLAFNLGLIGVFKYTMFVLGNVNAVLGSDVQVSIILPLAISFFTFQQIAFLVDVHGGVAKEPNFANYALFVTFFPHLIAGPITHHSEMIPQFAAGLARNRTNLVVGATVFTAGLIKKVWLADTFSQFVSPIYQGLHEGLPISASTAWGGMFSYALQLYFDFSGYSDMAIGLGLMFGIALPLNFNSPYKASNIIEFWSRWHMTLTRFLTAYIYNPLSMRARHRRRTKGLPVLTLKNTTLRAFASVTAIPTLVTFTLSGVWHGAGWQYVIFGVLHAIYLTIAQAWHVVRPRLGWSLPRWFTHPASVLLTFFCVMIAQVFFRAPDVATALTYLHALTNFGFKDELYLFASRRWNAIALLMAAVWFLPNLEQWMRAYQTALNTKFGSSLLDRYAPSVALWQPRFGWGFAFGTLGFLAVMRVFSGAPSEFIYFNF